MSFTLLLALLLLLRRRSKPVLIISLDGFRRDYLDRGLMPTLQYMAHQGIVADYLEPVFPSITFPNHYSIATGLYPGSHGIVSNHFYDSELKETFYYGNLTNNEESWWWKGAPIWKTVQKAGLLSAVIMWPGSEAKGSIPDFYLPFSNTMTMIEKCDQIIDWHDKHNINLFMMYVPEVDEIGHRYGVDSVQSKVSIKSAFVKITRMGHISRMTNTSPERIIYLDDIIDLSLVNIFEAGPFMMLYGANQSHDNLLYKKLHEAHENFSVWNHDTLPKEFHYLYQTRIGPIIIQAHLGFVLTSHIMYNGTGRYPWPVGFHGYPSSERDMHALFLAYGPSFMKEKKMESFPNVEIYQLISYLLRITPSSNNGTDGWLQKMKNLMI